MKPVSIQFFLNHRLDPNEVKRQVKELAGAGYQTVAGHARQGLLTPFMSHDWWNAIDVIVSECKQLGMNYCIWDEDYFPSGHAGGRVVWNEPELGARSLEFSVNKVSGSGPFELDFDKGMFIGAWAISESGEQTDITEYTGTRRQEWTPRYIQHGAYSPQVGMVGNPHWRCTFTDNRYALVWTPEKSGDYTIVAAWISYSSGAPDILRPESISRFIEYAYEPYYQRYAEYFGNVIDTAFTDEPSCGGMTHPWTPRFFEEFETDHGYELRQYLPHLAVFINEKSPVIRHHYRQTQSRLLRKCYIKQLADWCKDHSIEFTGHLTRTEWISLTSVYWPDELRCYMDMSVPCCDPLGAACAVPDASAYSTGVKVVSSAAHLFGKRQAGSDALAVIGDEATLRDMKFMLDFQMVLGVNAFMLHGASYSLDGPRKDEVPPSISYQHSEWPYFNELTKHVSETCEILTGGKHICNTAVLYPSTSLYCQAEPTYNWYNLPDENKIHALVDTLLSSHKDFDFIDEITLAEQADSNGNLNTPEQYSHIILPYLRYIDYAAAQALEKCASNNIEIIVVGHIPVILGNSPEAQINKLDIPGMAFIEFPVPSAFDSIQGPDISGEGSSDIFVLQRKTSNGEIAFLVNRAEKQFIGKFNGKNVTIAPKGSMLLKPNMSLPDAKTSRSIEIRDWTVKFGPNTVPLNFWHAGAKPGPDEYSYPALPPGFDLMNREKDPTANMDGTYCYTCRVYISGSISSADIVMDESAVSGNWSMYVNDVLISDWKKSSVFDCMNIKARVEHALKSGSTPTLNLIRIEASGSAHCLSETPYLVGNFKAEYRNSHFSVPYLEAQNGVIDLPALQSWQVIGYPTYSGIAEYRADLIIDESGDYLLDLCRVEDIAEVIVDGKQLSVMPWPPYTLTLSGLSEGKHTININIANSPANRTRGAKLSSGLLGPVTISHISG